MCFLVLDDWYDDLKTNVSSGWNTAKQFVADNKDFVHSILGTLIKSTIPAATPIFDAAWTAFGG